MYKDRIKYLEDLGFVGHRPIKFWINFDQRKIFREDFLNLNEQSLTEKINKENNTEDWLLFTADKELKLSIMDIKLIFGL